MHTTPHSARTPVPAHSDAPGSSKGATRRRWTLLAVAALLLEVVALGAVLIDGRHLTWIAWVPGWAGAGLALVQGRTGRRPRVLAVVTAVLFVPGTVLGIVAAVR